MHEIEKFPQIPKNETLDFEALGFRDVERLPQQSKNEIYVGHTKDGEKCFIKRYVLRPGRESADAKYPEIEISCYENLKDLNLPRVVSKDLEKRYLALEYLELEDLELSTESIDEVLDFFVEKILPQNHSFLSESNIDYYEDRLFPKLESITGQFPEMSGVIEKISAGMEKIEKAKKYFSHNDFFPGNIKKSSSGITLIDFEFAGQDNAMYDLAAFFISLESSGLKTYFMEKISKFDFFDQELFDLMCLRRSSEAVLAMKDEQHSEYFKRNKAFLDEILK